MSEDMLKNKIDKILDRSGINNSQFIKFDQINMRFALLGEISDTKVLIKIVEKNNLHQVKRLEKEILVSDLLLGAVDGEYQKILRNISSIGSGHDEEFFWIIRKYMTAEQLTTNIDGNQSYTRISAEFLNSKDQILTSVSSIISDFSKVSQDGLVDTQLFKPRFETELENYNLALLEKSIGFELTDAVNFYKQNRQNEKKVLIMGDLVPSNILVADSGIMIIDYEWASFDTRMSDISFLWLFLFRYPDWQKNGLI